MDNKEYRTAPEQKAEGEGAAGQERAAAPAGMDFREAMGLKKVEAGDGRAKCEMEVQPFHNNILGILHGGVLFSIADTTSGMAVLTVAGDHVNTVSGNINYLRPGKDTAKIVAEAEVVKCGSTLAVVDCRIMDDKGVLLATTTMTFYIFAA